MSETLTEALERAALTPKEKHALDLLARLAPELSRALPVGVSVEWFERTARAELRRTPLLAECDPYSFLGAVMHTAQLGLDPGPLGLIYLYPFKREVTLTVGFRGYIELAYRSGLVRDVSAELVYEGDVFKVKRGTSPKIEHEQAGPVGEREITAAYAVAHLKSGGTPTCVVYPEDWEQARMASQLGRRNEGAWGEHYPAMIRKTALRRLEPTLPKTPQLGMAVVLDEGPAARLDDQLAGVLYASEGPDSDAAA